MQLPRRTDRLDQIRCIYDLNNTDTNTNIDTFEARSCLVVDVICGVAIGSKVAAKLLPQDPQLRPRPADLSYF